MKLLTVTLLLLFIAAHHTTIYDYIIFTQVWPGSYIKEGNITNSNFTNNYFVIHGLWPNFYNGSWPAYCNPNATFNVTELEPILPNLTRFWTDFVDPEQLWAHEYTKHGTCVGNNSLLNSELLYFQEGLIQRNKYDIYELLAAKDIYPSNSKCYDTDHVQDCLDKAISHHVVLICDSDDTLAEVQICLDKELYPFACPDNLFADACKSPSIVYNMVVT